MRRMNALELAHIDACQVDAKSHAGAQYFVTFMDVLDIINDQPQGKRR